MKKPFKILCIDGGGIKGLFSAQVLAKFEEVFKTNISDQFDLICGTSTGGIIALAASTKIPMYEVVRFYEDKGPLIFAEHQKGFLGKMWLLMKQMFYKGKYSNKELKKALIEVFGSREISESSNLLCITSFNITTASPRVFKKDYNHFTEDSRKKYVDVALATSAAPTYLPIHELGADQFVDGGVWANNPSLVGLMEFLYQFSEDERFDGVDILSISSLEVPQGRAPMPSNSSVLNWQSKLIDLFSIGQAKNIEKLFEYLDGKFRFPIRYTRVSNEPLSHEQMKIIDMDNASPKALKVLQAVGNATANQAKMRGVIREVFTTGKTI